MIPEGATAIDPAGTAPGLVVPAGEMVVIVLPGPPRELQAMWPQAIETRAVREVLARTEPFETMAIRKFGIPESELAASLREIEREVDLSALEITTCLRRGELHVDVRYRAGAEEAAEALKRGLIERHRRFLFSVEGESIEEIVFGLLQGKKIGLAESCTGGLLAVRLTNRPRSSGYFAGGVVSYSNEAKVEVLGVPEELIEEHGAVSLEVAEAMADGALERFDADVACSITGIAGPDGGSDEKPVGYVCFCVKERDGDTILRELELPGDRLEVRDRSSTVALHLLRNLLTGTEPAR
jgi:nicotinamide-nucleotide amidase